MANMATKRWVARNKWAIYVQGAIKSYAGISAIIGGFWLLKLVDGNISSIIGAGIIISGLFVAVNGIFGNLIRKEWD